MNVSECDRAIAHPELRFSLKAHKPSRELSDIHCLHGFIVAATVTHLQRLCEKFATRNTSGLISAVDSCIRSCLARILGPRNEVGREHEGAGMNSIRRIFGLRRLPTCSSAPMRHTFAGGRFST